MIIDVISSYNLAAKHMIVGILSVLTCGCSISVPQAESSYQFVKEHVWAVDASSQEPATIWLASVGDRGAVLRPYLSGGLTVFANSDGDAIAFDGWVIRSIVGFGLPNPLSISGRDGKRTFVNATTISSTECGQWRLTELTWQQSCALGDGQIVLSRDRNIELISMSLTENLGIVTLRLAK